MARIPYHYVNTLGTCAASEVSYVGWVVLGGRHEDKYVTVGRGSVATLFNRARFTASWEVGLCCPQLVTYCHRNILLTLAILN